MPRASGEVWIARDGSAHFVKAMVAGQIIGSQYQQAGVGSILSIVHLTDSFDARFEVVSVNQHFSAASV